MLHTSKKLQDGRYGIYINNELAATTTCSKIYKRITEALEERAKQNQKYEKVTKAA